MVRESCSFQFAQTINLDVLQPAVERFSAAYPRTVERLTKLELHGTHTALGFSELTKLVALTIDAPILREPDDIDLLAPNEEFEEIAGVLGVNMLPLAVKKLDTRDGLSLRFGADEIQAEADRPIQLVRPLTPMRSGRHSYQTAFTDTAVNARKVYQTNEGLVPIAHPADAMLIYAIGQRLTHTKDDAFNLSILRKFCPPTDPYLRLRGQELHADARVWQFVAHAGQTATAQRVLVAA